MKKLTSIEVIVMFRTSASKLARWRKDGLKCTMIDGSYYYDYDDVVEFCS